MTAPQSAFSANNRLQDLAPVTADIVIYRDDFNNNSSGCVAAVNAGALTGKIALIDRAGTCQFSVKARNAQNAGAVGVIVVSDANSAIGTMGGTADNTVTIPAVMISFADGQRIRTELNNGGTVNATLQGIQRDGDVDNGIIAHEFAHGISTRFTGGPGNSSCLNNAEQMGEGWSDYYTLLSTTNWATATVNDGPRVRGIGTYAIGQNPVTGGGIRPFPYSTSMSVNPQTYGTVASYGLVNGQTPVHAVGSVWCTMLWEMTWEIIALDGINPNLYNVNATGGNSIALRLVNEGMRLQPCNPGFVDGRNAILQADTLLYGGRYSCAIWKAFAKRGLGVGASQGASTSYTDGVQDFRTPASASITKLSNKEHASQGEEITYTLRATCQCSPVSNLRIVDTLPANVTFVSSVGGTYNASTRTISYSNISLAAAASQNFSYTVRVDNGTFTAPTEHINDNVPANALSAPWFSFSLAGTVFEASSTRFRSAGFSYFAQNMATAQERVIFSTAGYPLTRVSTLRFWHYFNTESGYDGGVVELDVDGSGNWVDAGPYMITNGYNSRINADATGNPLAGRAAFTGSSNGQFINTVLNLASLAGRTVSVRFRFNSDNGVAGEGWYIDDINLTSRSGIFNSVDLYDNANSLISASNNITNINAFTLPVVWGSFTAEKVGTNAILTWQTLQEQNTKHFVLERSLDGTQFASIFTTQARGNSTQVQTYRYTDVSPVKGINYYRIKQVDNDGRFTYSEVRTVRFDGQKGAISVIPNPIKSTFAVQIVGNQSLATIELLSMSGQKLAAYQQISELAKHEVPAGTKPGTYLLRIVDATSSTTQKIIIQ
ncbi:MAG: T9SS C-terminal target domain-containing protein [Bacteroidetes bacterium]|nr:MAG: T9SS C-terminal target domain-containing protein [Bacteroidota bacterium]